MVSTPRLIMLPLYDVCTTSYVSASLSHDVIYLGTTPVTIDPSSIQVNPVLNNSVSGSANFPDATFDYCNVTFAYTHTGRNDSVLVAYWLPSPASFKNRYLATGGGGYAINSGIGNTGSLPGGVIYGAVAGATDGGFGSFSNNWDSVYIIQNGTVDLESLFMFGYQGINELTLLGQLFTKSFFNMTCDDKLYSYYQGCSEGGREGWSQVQRFTDFDGVITGAPAFRFSFQQIQHLYSNVVEQTLDYYPPACELQKILNETIASCDPLDGLTDGVVARTDLCKLQFNTSSIIGNSYYCPASPECQGFPPAPAWPEQNGTVTAEGVAVANAIVDGLHDSNGKRVYFSYQPSSIFADGFTSYNTTSDTWGLYINSFGSEFVARYLELLNTSTLPNLDGVTYDTLRTWIIQGWKKYQDTLQTTWPDLTDYYNSGGKIIHFHGESDFSIPTASSVRYHESVRQIMYGNLTFNESTEALGDWYRLYLVPGAQHCAPNTYEPNGPFPQTNLGVMIDWVEQGITPVTLNATHLAGENAGANAQICAWPLRPLWAADGSMDCVYDQASIDSWLYELDSFNVPVY
ncbi:feruloyl esterase-like protein B precursor [Mollisia scopiformis]|uniref:Carboxylic ester hydrolase n=1 Tax=Mollisia scopiformis TaxID=149040 RepID=A0A132B466_MOLSC|nr:feruloyl esterase-like protein B precursor [Mollisia scopiformis]KUJ06809.1 feruloyl esteras-like protein B precursor [Mollisia scopiformis]